MLDAPSIAPAPRESPRRSSSHVTSAQTTTEITGRRNKGTNRSHERFGSIELSFGEKSANLSVIIQRVKSASVTVDEELISSIGKGLLVLAGVGKEDSEKEAENVVNKILKAKFWPDENGSQVRSFPWREKSRDCYLSQC